MKYGLNTLLLVLIVFLTYQLLSAWLHLLKFKQRKAEHAKPEILLAVGILSKLSAEGRRDAIRLTWFKVCRKRQLDVFCRFFTDSLHDLSGGDRKKYEEEFQLNNDLSYMPYKGGYNFSLRLIWMIEWYRKHFDFKYFLRVDDDYFLCLNHLLHELPHRPTKGLYWGYLHCREHVVRIDEGWMLLSRDFIDESIEKVNTTLQCHPYGDQAVALWVSKSKIDIKYFADNERIVHAATAFQLKKYLRGNICGKHIGLHGAYPAIMLKYWILTQDYVKQKKDEDYIIPKIPAYSKVCNFSKTFDWRYFYPHVRFEPKLCKDNPVWSITGQNFTGRQDMGKEAIY